MVVVSELEAVAESPTAVVAFNVIVYEVATDNPEMVKGDVVVLASMYSPPFNEYLYVVMAEPPFEPGAVNATVIWRFPVVKEFNMGEPG